MRDIEHFTDTNKDRVYNWVRGNKAADFEDRKPILKIQTSAGIITARLNDYIIRDTDGEYYICKPEQFINNFKHNFNKEELEKVFTKGNCYHFAVILKELYKGKILYDPVQGHFITEINNKCYDIKGIAKTPTVYYNWERLEKNDKLLYDRLVRECVYKE